MGGDTPQKSGKNRLFHRPENRFFSYQNSFPKTPTPGENDPEGGGSAHANFQPWGWLGDSSSSTFWIWILWGVPPPIKCEFFLGNSLFWLPPGNKIEEASMGWHWGGVPPIEFDLGERCFGRCDGGAGSATGQQPPRIGRGCGGRSPTRYFRNEFNGGYPPPIKK